ncbi:peptidoglycan editing factor PgeF [Methylovulum psychrotolerans]|uniref:Purine nucleoside phosphorylase n=1 Tax=Methylovulum psychrotolerans TaxID=1704499 RepID=A0A1Z4BTP6_9GAMM|nr:peptidoglycan editing factor PgeF [Methylovulum psychrotolerans]ASF44677.1 multi-copper polyphenol oxidoreductase [Methylovulum psychrotolerans]MBT9098796.1 peptidoglycan editing factor PgeF [Methylovulum psychrotolerans]POZ52624.1 peptidoglycan editing factor PgeF [Methylovulum psychrotolerans]
MSKNKSWLSPDWPAPAQIRAATTLRTGGFSLPPYASLNPALHVGDDAGTVTQNRQHIRAMLALPAEPVWLAQTHSDQVVDAAIVSGVVSADASFTDQAGVVCAVLTADCLPVLVCSADGQKVAAIHAGWRGLAAGIISKTIAALQTTDVLVWLGPAIGPACFEVGDEVRAAFVAKDPANGAEFTAQGGDKWLADIYGLARRELAALGVSHVYGGGLCTVTDASRFYSFRREPVTGRMASLIWRI